MKKYLTFMTAVMTAVLLFVCIGCSNKIDTPGSLVITADDIDDRSGKSTQGVTELFDSSQLQIDKDENGAYIHEVGVPENLTGTINSFKFDVKYPRLSSDNADGILRSWAQQTVDEYSKKAADGYAELNVGYNTYKAGEGFIGVKEIGSWFSASGETEDVIFTMNINTSTGEEADIFTEDGRTAVSELLSEKTGRADISLDNCVLTSSGIQVILPGDREKGENAPVVYSLDTEELSGMLAISTDEGGISANIDPDKPMIALTFDDGPSKNTPHLLELLRQVGGKASFCMVGDRLEDYPDTVQQVVDEGCEILTHTWDHSKLTDLSDEAAIECMTKPCKKIKEMTGYTVKCLRPPYGSINKNVEALAGSQGLAVINWSIDTLDWKTKDPDNTFKVIKDEVRDGSIILCHDLYEATAKAMDMAIPYLAQQGYQLVTVSELLYYKQGGAVPGAYYLHG